MIELNYSPEEIAELARVEGLETACLRALSSISFYEPGKAQEYFISLAEALPGDLDKRWQILFCIIFDSLKLQDGKIFPLSDATQRLVPYAQEDKNPCV